MNESVYDVEVYDENNVPEEILEIVESQFIALGHNKEDFDFCQYLVSFGNHLVCYESKFDPNYSFNLELDSELHVLCCEVSED